MLKKGLYTCLIITSILLLSSCNNMRTNQYNQKTQEFDNIFNLMAQDFYNQCNEVINNGKPNKDLYGLYKDNLQKLNQIFKDYNQITASQDLQDRKKLYDLVMKISLYSQTQEVGNVSYWTDFKSLMVQKYSTLITTDISNNNSKSELELLDKTDVVENGLHYITGTIINNANVTYGYVTVTINIYDKDGNLLGNTTDNVSNLEAGQKWKFKAIVTQKNFTQYKITEIKGI